VKRVLLVMLEAQLAQLALLVKLEKLDLPVALLARQVRQEQLVLLVMSSVASKFVITSLLLPSPITRQSESPLSWWNSMKVVSSILDRLLRLQLLRMEFMI